MTNEANAKTTYDKYTSIYKKKLHHSLIFTTICGFLGIVIAILFYLCKNVFSPSAISAVYTDNIFYYINTPLRLFSQIFPFSIGEILLYAIIVIFLLSLFKIVFITIKMAKAYSIIKANKSAVKLRHCFVPFINFGFNVTSIACILISAFILLGGINYTGLTYAERAGYIISPASTKDLKDLCLYLSTQASLSRNQLKTNFNNTIDENYPGYNPYKMAEDAQIAYKNLPERYMVSKRDFPNVKFALSSYFMSNIHITGIYPYVFPEAIVNVNTPIMSLPHTICHEMAHQRGFAREDEANFIAFISCIHSSNPLMRYSGYYVAYSYAMDQLYIYDRESWNKILSTTDSGVLLDIKKEAAYWDQFQQISSELTTNINDTYLSAMDIHDGVNSYGRMVDLLIAEAKLLGIIS